MKKKTISLLLTLMIFTAFSMMPANFALADAIPAAEDPVLATVNGEAITRSQAEKLIPMFIDNQFIADATDYQYVVEALVRQKVVTSKIKDMGFDVFSQEETDALKQEAQTEWDSMFSEYADYYQAEDTPEARQAALVQAESYFAGQGISLDVITRNIQTYASMDRMSEYLLAGYQPTEEEVQQVFSQVGASYQQRYENDIQQYEYMTQLYGQSSWYTPEGYRGIIHILLSVDDGLMQKLKSLQAAFEEQNNKTEEMTPDSLTATDSTAQPEPATGVTESAEPVTLEMIQSALQEVLDSRKEDIAEIFSRIEKGDSFEQLITEYGTDPGMTDEDLLVSGYAVHKDSVVWDPAFITGAFSPEMQQPGDVSQPVVGQNGIHILKYLCDVPSGLLMTDAIHEEISDYLLSVKENQLYAAAYDGWASAFDIVYNQDAIDLASQEAAAQAQSTEELAPEAVPSVGD